MAKMSIGVQLYTLRDQIKQDFAGTVKQLSKIGYAGVELAGYGNLKSAGEVKKALDDAGLKIVANHVWFPSLETELNKQLDEQDVLGNKMLIVPWLEDSRHKDAASWRKVAESVTSIAREAAKRGFTLAYHNHAFEFDKFEGKSGFEILWEHTDPKLVKSELDVYWIKFGGEDPVTYIKKLSNRVVLLHLKDMAAGPERKFAPVGTGILDFKSILSAGEQVGVKWGLVEQDNCYDMPPIESIRISFENLKKIGAV